MAFFDKVKEAASTGFSKAKEAGTKGLDKAKDMGEIGKLKVKKGAAEGKMKEIFAELGKNLYSEHFDVLEQVFPEQAAQLVEFANSIADMDDQIEAIKAKADEAAEEAAEAVEETAEEVVETVTEEQ